MNGGGGKCRAVQTSAAGNRQRNAKRRGPRHVARRLLHVIVVNAGKRGIRQHATNGGNLSVAPDIHRKSARDADVVCSAVRRCGNAGESVHKALKKSRRAEWGGGQQEGSVVVVGRMAEAIKLPTTKHTLLQEQRHNDRPHVPEGQRE